LLIDHATVDFESGVYVLAGVDATQSEYVFETENQAFITGGSSTTPDAGRMFFLTDDDNPALTDALIAVNGEHDAPMPDLSFGSFWTKAGANDKSGIQLQGLNAADDSGLPAEYVPYGPVVIWQDRRNSNYAYTEDGRYWNCGDDVNAACTYEDAYGVDAEGNIVDGRGPVSPAMFLEANQNTDLWGAIYQPRGAWLHLWAGTGKTGPLMVVTGSLLVHSGAELTLTGPPRPITRFVAALVE